MNKLENSNSSDSDNSHKKPKVTRRSVACKSCHSLKVKCTPSDPNNPGAPCIRCVNAGRTCEIDLNQTRKRRKKAEILEARRLAELNQHQQSQSQQSSQLPSQQQPHHSHSNSHHLHHHQQNGSLSEDQMNVSESSTNGFSNNNYGSNDSSIISGNGSRYELNSPQGTRPIHGSASTIPPVSSNLNPNPSPPMQQPMTPQLPSPYDSGIIKGQPSSPISKDAEITQLKERVKFLESQLSNRNQFNRRRDTAIDLVADVQSPPFISKYDLESEISILAESSAKLTDLTNQLNESASRRTQLVAAKEPIDLIYKNIITVEQAEERLAVYRDRIYKEYPLIEIPENVSAMEFSRTQPFLFNAIMSACNVITKNTTRDTALSIDNEAIKTIAVEVMVVGTKSVELVKAFLVLCLYYNSPELFKQRRYHMLNTICVSLLHDLGIVVRPTYSYNQQEGTIKQDIPVVGQSNDEYRSLVLTTYFTTVSICLVLRRSIYARWTSYVEECCTALENSPQEKYQTLALFARMNNKLDKIHHIIHAPEVPERPSNASNYIIQELQRSLSELKEKIKENQHGLLSYYYSIEAYLHEPMLSSVFKSDSGLDSNSIKSLCFCTGSCLNALDEYSKLTPDQIVLMPFSFGSRVMYTTGMLLRLRYLILSLPSQIDKELVPKRAVTAIQKVSKLVEQANILNPSNHYLTKMRLVLQLFIQTYATQVLDLLRKNGETPQNFKPNESEFQHLKSLAKEYNSARHNKESMLADSRDSEPLDVLSYAATFRRDENNRDKLALHKSVSESLENGKKTVSHPNFGSVGNSPTSFTPNTTTTPGGPVRFPMAASDHTANNNNNNNADSNHSTAHSGLTPSLHQFGDVVQPTGMTFHDFRNFRLPSIANTLDNNNKLNVNLANPDQLENSYMVLNDEFWSNLLSTDSTTDRINFTNNNFNGSSINDEVFFMNN